MHRALLIALIPVLATTGLFSAAEPLTFLRAVEMPGVKGRIDHLAVDLPSGRTPDSSPWRTGTAVISCC